MKRVLGWPADLWDDDADRGLETSARSAARRGAVSLPRTGLGQDARGYAGGAFTITPADPHSLNGGSPSTIYDNTSPDSTTQGLTVELTDC